MDDVTLKPITIPGARVEKATEYLLAHKPVPQEQEVIDGVPQLNDDLTPKLVDKYGLKTHIDIVLKTYLHRICGKGKKKLNSQPAETDLFI